MPCSAEIRSFYILSKSLGAWHGQKISENCGFGELIALSDPKYSKWGDVPMHFQKKCTNRTTPMDIIHGLCPCHQGRGRRGGGSGGPDPPTFENRGVNPRTFYDVFFFALNCINIKQTMIILTLVKSILSKDEINLMSPKKQRNFVSPILVITLMRQ